MRGILHDLSLVQHEDPPCILMTRAMREDEHSFVLSAWVKGYAHSAFAIRRGPHYWQEQERIAKWCMTRGHVLVAAAEEAPDAALGWICGLREPATIDYVYVKHDARRLGVAAGLIMGLAGVPWREWRPRMTHKSWRRELRSMVEAQGWVFSPITDMEMGR